KEDFKGAFKSLPLRAEHLPFAVISWRTAAEQAKGLQLICCPFGSSASVHSWHRLGSFFQAMLARDLFVAYPRFVDDLFSADSCLDAASALTGPVGTAHCAEQLLGLTGWVLEPSKRVRGATSTTILGVDVSARSGEIIFQIGPAKQQKWLDTIQEALQSDALRPAEAKRLAGRLNWAGSAVFGKGARAYLAALHWQANRRTARLTARVQTALTEVVDVDDVAAAPLPGGGWVAAVVGRGVQCLARAAGDESG
ncbi:MAG: hypothetical protein GY824_21375, partial [Delftia sp.]|nr:hypothetical protein [Delftia sp.]